MKIELKAGDILSCTSSGWLGKTIQLFTKSRINHSAFVLELWGEIYIIDSQKDGTNPRKLADWQKKFEYVYQIHRPKENIFNIKTLQKRAMSKSGDTPYDFKSLVWYQPMYLLTGKWFGSRGTKANESMYCSEYVSWIYDIKEWWAMSPSKLFDYLNKSKDFDYVK